MVRPWQAFAANMSGSRTADRVQGSQLTELMGQLPRPKNCISALG